MKPLVGLTVAAVVTGSLALADPLVGTWQTEADDGAYAHVTIAPCGGAFCGTIVHVPGRC